METTEESSGSESKDLDIYLSWIGQLSARESVIKWGDWETDIQTNNDQTTYDERFLAHGLSQSAKNGQDLAYECQRPYFLPLFPNQDQPESQTCSPSSSCKMHRFCFAHLCFLMPTSSNQSLPEPFHFWHYKAFPLPLPALEFLPNTSDGCWLPCSSELWMDRTFAFFHLDGIVYFHSSSRNSQPCGERQY